METDLQDVLIIGAGPTGLACAIEAQRNGLNYTVIEKGCIVNSIQNFPVQMTFFTTPELLEIGGLPMISSYEKPTRIEALKYYRRVADTYQLKIHLYETVLRVEGEDGRFRVHTRRKDGEAGYYHAKKIVLATGYYDIPNYLGIRGEDSAKVFHYYTEAHPYYGMDVLVIGGKNSAAIAALDLYRHGARVTLIHRRKELSGSIKYWIRPDIENRIKNGEIACFYETEAIEIAPQSVLLRHHPSGRTWSLKNDFVFAMTGYRPDLEFFKSIGIHLNPTTQKPDFNSTTYESGIPGVYLAGVVVAGMLTNEVFIENGRFHGEVIIKHICQVLQKPSLVSS
ncbi:MAG: YpdA family putative bacillithiol disulfide reductase [Acidobacteriota bacterium]